MEGRPCSSPSMRSGTCVPTFDPAVIFVIAGRLFSRPTADQNPEEMNPDPLPGCVVLDMSGKARHIVGHDLYGRGTRVTLPAYCPLPAQGPD